MADAPESAPVTEGGILSVVGTPIGNLGDASPRVVETLRQADVILCEDTRVTGRLCARFDVHARLERCDENVIAARTASVIERIQAGNHVAFVSDAGMPCVSDPGQRLVDAALDAGVRVEVVPGPSALTCALAASGLSSEHFFFEGFLPRKPTEQARRLSRLAAIPATLVVYESPHRVAKTLGAVATAMPGRRVALVREITKLHEEVVRGLAPEVAALVATRPEVKGECVVVIEAPSSDAIPSEPPELPLDDAIGEGLAAGTPKSRLARELSASHGVPRSEVYARILELDDAADRHN